MKFSTIISFIFAVVMTFASAADVAPAQNLRGLDAAPVEFVSMESMTKEDFPRVLEAILDNDEGRKLKPPSICYTRYCYQKVRGSCWYIWPQCYPL
jgi:hypothetical protein